MSPSRRIVAVLGAFFLILLLYSQRIFSQGHQSHSTGADGFTSLRPTDQTIFEVAVNAKCPEKLKTDERPGRFSGRPVQFIHLPKAGGTSVQEMLIKWATSGGIPRTLHDGDGPTWNSPMARGLFLGHRGYGFSARVRDKNPLTIIAMREPVSRIVSLFDYLRRTDETVPSVLAIKQAWHKQTLDEVVEAYRETRERDPASLLPGGSASFSDRTLHRVLQSQIQFLCGYDCVWFMTGDKRESYEPFAKQQVLERAKANLEQIDCIAVLNRLDDLLVQLKVHLDFVPRNFNSFPHENTVNPKERSQPSEKTLQLLREWTRDEQELYERAKQLASRKTADAAQCLQDQQHPSP